MKTKSMLQLLVPFASTVVLFILFWILSFLIWIIGFLMFELLNFDADSIEEIMESIYYFFQVNIFEFRGPFNHVNINMVIFWILNTIVFILAELWVSDEDFD